MTDAGSPWPRDVRGIAVSSLQGAADVSDAAARRTSDSRPSAPPCVAGCPSGAPRFSTKWRPEHDSSQS